MTEKNDKSFLASVNEFLYSRMDRINTSTMSLQPQFLQQKQSAYSDRYNRVREMLQESGQKTQALSQLEDAWFELDSLSQDVNYRAGFLDGIRFLTSLTGGDF